MKAVNSLKLTPHDSVDLDRLSYSNGDLVFDVTLGTIRLMDGSTLGGSKIATQGWVASNSITTATLTTTLANYVTTSAQTTALSTALSSYVTSTSLSTAAVASAGKLTTSRTINSVGFDGSANITVSTLVNGAKTITLNSSGNLVIPGASGGGLISSTGYNYASTIGSLIIDGDQVALDYRGNNNLFVDQFGIEFYTNTTGTSGFNASIPANNYWAFSPNGTSTFPGNIITTAGTVTAKQAIIGGVNIKAFAIAMGAGLA